jgi:hypothetical protein
MRDADVLAGWARYTQTFAYRLGHVVERVDNLAGFAVHLAAVPLTV